MPEHYTLALRSLGACRMRLVTDVYLPGALPSIVVGLRLGMGYGWRALIAAEMLVRQGGLGDLIFGARTFGQIDRIITGMILIGTALHHRRSPDRAADREFDHCALGGAAQMSAETIAAMCPTRRALGHLIWRLVPVAPFVIVLLIWVVLWDVVSSFSSDVTAGPRCGVGDPRARGFRSACAKRHRQPRPIDPRQLARHRHRRRRRLCRGPQPQRRRNPQPTGRILQRHLRHRLVAAHDHLDRYRHRACGIFDLEHGIFHRVPKHRAWRATGAGSARAGRARARRQPDRDDAQRHLAWRAALHSYRYSFGSRLWLACADRRRTGRRCFGSRDT